MSRYLKYTIPNGDCLEWTRCFNSDGYPRAGNKSTSNLKVHREVFNDVYGYYPPVVRHKCDNIKCINPDHLLPGTDLDNVKDRNERGRTRGHISQELFDIVISLREEGYMYKEIAVMVDRHWKSIDYMLNEKSRKGKGY